MNERDFLAQLEAANTEELAQLLRRPSAEEERLLEIYFGAERLRRLRQVARSSQRRALSRGNVVVLHGIMGGELTVFPANEKSQHIWMNIPRLVRGAVGWLRMRDDFSSQFEIRPTGMIKKYYAEQLLGLAAGGWSVLGIYYDWRLDLALVADGVRRQIDSFFGPTAPVNLVAHSMGGLVSRTYIQRHPDRWKRGGRLVMLGTPNHGSFAIPQVITGAYDTIRKLALVDLSHNLRDLCAILNGFPGSLEMLPSPLQMPAMERMYDAKLWAPWNLPQRILDLARKSHERLAPIVDGARMSYIAGCNQVTKVGVRDWNRLDRADSYTDSMAGDGTVPHALSFLEDGGQRIPTYFVAMFARGAAESRGGDRGHTADSRPGKMRPAHFRADAARAALGHRQRGGKTRARTRGGRAAGGSVAPRAHALARSRGGAPNTAFSRRDGGQRASGAQFPGGRFRQRRCRFRRARRPRGGRSPSRGRRRRSQPRRSSSSWCAGESRS